VVPLAARSGRDFLEREWWLGCGLGNGGAWRHQLCHVICQCADSVTVVKATEFRIRIRNRNRIRIRLTVLVVLSGRRFVRFLRCSGLYRFALAGWWKARPCESRTREVMSISTKRWRWQRWLQLLPVMNCRAGNNRQSDNVLISRKDHKTPLPGQCVILVEGNGNRNSRIRLPRMILGIFTSKIVHCTMVNIRGVTMTTESSINMFA